MQRPQHTYLVTPPRTTAPTHMPAQPASHQPTALDTAGASEPTTAVAPRLTVAWPRRPTSRDTRDNRPFLATADWVAALRCT